MQLFTFLTALYPLLVSATFHDLVVGSFSTAALYSFQFDDVQEELVLTGNSTTGAASSWIALSHDKSSLYGTSYLTTPATFVSYTIATPTHVLRDKKSLSIGGACKNSTAKAIFVIAATKPPFNVYGTPFGSNAGCGIVMRVDETGGLDQALQNYDYSSISGVHGLGFGFEGSVLYSADDNGNAIWTHSVDEVTGNLSLIDSVAAPKSGADPRQLVAHPNGMYVYVVMESANTLVQYETNATTKAILRNTADSWTLIPENVTNSNYMADTVTLSPNLKYAWATTRSRNANATGYISAYSLSKTGAIQKQLFLLPTTASGGLANAVTACEFSDQYVVITDSVADFVEIWKMAEDESSASAVAHLSLKGYEPANAVWLS